MKFLLTSSGFTNQDIIDACVDLVGKPTGEINVAIINEGYAVEPGDHTWILDELALVRSAFGGVIEFVNLLALDALTIKERINHADVIYVVGGHTDYLMSVFNKSGLSSILPELLKSKVYVGSSAGSMVIGKRVQTETYQKIYGEVGTYDIEKYLELVDFSIKPHFNSPGWPNNRKEVLLEVTQNHSGTLYGLSDASAVKVIDDQVEVIGTDWLKIIDGIAQ